MAGNTGFVSQEFYIDRTAPEITGFVVEKAPETAAQRVLNKLGFGTFGNGMLSVTVSAEDVGESAGLKSIPLYLDDAVYETKEADKNGKAVFKIPAQDISDSVRKIYLDKKIYARAEDNVGNEKELQVGEVCFDAEEPAILIGNSDTGVLLGNNVSEESARECFNRLKISVAK